MTLCRSKWNSGGAKASAQIVRFNSPMLGISSTFSLRFAEQGDAGRLYKAASKRMSVAFAPEEFHFDRAAAMNNPG